MAGIGLDMNSYLDTADKVGKGMFIAYANTDTLKGYCVGTYGAHAIVVRDSMVTIVNNASKPTATYDSVLLDIDNSIAEQEGWFEEPNWPTYEQASFSLYEIRAAFVAGSSAATKAGTAPVDAGMLYTVSIATFMNAVSVLKNDFATPEILFSALQEGQVGIGFIQHPVPETVTPLGSLVTERGP